MKRSAFALLEALLVVGIVGVVATFSVPLYSQWQIRNDLALAKNQVIQGLQRAKLNAQAGKGDTAWSFFIPEGRLFQGTDYQTSKADANVWAASEVFPMPETVKFTGLSQVSYDRQGNPNVTGTITLSAYNNEIDTINVVLEVAQSTIDTTVGSSLTICYQNVTMTVTYAAWPDWQAKGATQNACPGGASSSSVVSSGGSSAVSSSASSAASSVASSAASSAASSVASSASSAASSAASSVASSNSSHSSSSSSSSAAGVAGGTGGVSSSSSSSSTPYVGGGTDNCATKFTLQSDNVIKTNAVTSITFLSIAALRQLDDGTYIPSHDCYSTDNGSSFTKMFTGNGNCNGNGNAYGNAVAVNGGDTRTVSNIAANSKIVIKTRSKYQQGNWLSVNDIFNSKDDKTRFVFLKDGDNPTSAPGYWTQPTLKNLLQSRGYLNAQGKVAIGTCKLILATEMGSNNDYNDSTLMLTFQ